MPTPNTIHCPQCGSTTEVVNSRAQLGNSTLRRRKCAKGHRFSTIEKVATKVGRNLTLVNEALRGREDALFEVSEALRRIKDGTFS